MKLFQSVIYSYDVDNTITVKCGTALNIFYIDASEQPLCEHNTVLLEVL